MTSDLKPQLEDVTFDKTRIKQIVDDINFGGLRIANENKKKWLEEAQNKKFKFESVPFVCDQCGKDLHKLSTSIETSTTNLSKTLTRHYIQSEFNCKICKASFCSKECKKKYKKTNPVLCAIAMAHPFVEEELYEKQLLEAFGLTNKKDLDLSTFQNEQFIGIHEEAMKGDHFHCQAVFSVSDIKGMYECLDEVTAKAAFQSQLYAYVLFKKDMLRVLNNKNCRLMLFHSNYQKIYFELMSEMTEVLVYDATNLMENAKMSDT